ncbi:MAG TPA: host attachment protein [Verrucomicrobiae bacterium]|nr:host attachment protein [Verrucomicrobiae bacterium]
MRTKLLVLADSGHLKAYRLKEDPAISRPRLELLENWESAVPRHLREDVTDQAGQYRKGSTASGPSDVSDGEQHNIELERRRRALKEMAYRIDALAEREKPEGCYLAASSEINNSLVAELADTTRRSIEKNVSANLTRAGQDEVIRHFCE